MTSLTIAQARARLQEHGIHVSVTGMYRLVKQGKLPHVHLNRLYITDLDAFLAQQSQASTAPAPAIEPPTLAGARVESAARLIVPKRRRFGTPARDRRSA